MAVKPVPDGYHSITPYLVLNGAAKVIDFLKEAFGAQEVMRMPGPNGTIGHAEIKNGDSIVMMAEPVTRSPVRVRGRLRSHSGHRYGFESVDLSLDQREVISKACRTLALLQ